MEKKFVDFPNEHHAVLEVSYVGTSMSLHWTKTPGTFHGYFQEGSVLSRDPDVYSVSCKESHLLSSAIGDTWLDSNSQQLSSSKHDQNTTGAKNLIKNAIKYW